VGRSNNVVWGIFLVVLGGLLILERFGHVHIPAGSLWPLILFVIGISKLLQRRLGSAVMFFLIGSVFLCCTLGLYGMTYEKSWPLLMVAAGVGMVIRSLTGESSRPRMPRAVDHE
jgi:Na+/melibiose symporter-like transporter